MTERDAERFWLKIRLEIRMEKRIIFILSDLLNQKDGIIVRCGPCPSSPAASEFNDAFRHAYKRGAIDKRESARIAGGGLVVRGTNRETGETVYAVADASWVIDEDAVIKAHRNAELVAKVYPDAKTEAVVYGTTINDGGRDAAERLGVVVYDSVFK